MNPVLMLVHNCGELTKAAIGSVMGQDIPVTLYVVDNDSDEATQQWLAQAPVKVMRRSTNGVSSGWNFGLSYLFDTAFCDHVLVVNNDVVLRSDTYRTLMEQYGRDFATAVSVGDTAQLEWDGQIRPRPHPDFSCYLIRRSVWDKIGPFDESMVLYASDGDYHLRMHKAGIEACTIGIPFYHYASGTLKTSTPAERQLILEQADKDRATFRNKWGCDIGSQEYYQLFNGSEP